MRKIVIALMGTFSALVLVVSFDASRRDGGTVTTADGDDGAAPTASSESDPGSSSTAASTSSAKGISGSFTGDEVDTRWGVVQVKITVKNGKITKAKALQYPQENHHDQEINSWAIPQLQKMTVDNQGTVDSLSGATVTSDGYRQSLQSALDQANL